MGEYMKLWLLRPVGNLPADDNPWEPEYDKAHGFVIRAATEGEARDFAHHEAGDENRSMDIPPRHDVFNCVWKDARYSTCVELLAEGEEEVVMTDFYHG